MKKKVIFYFVMSGFILFNSLPFLFAKGPSQERRDFLRLLFFYSDSCHACQKVKHELIPGIEKDFFDKVIIEYLDIADAGNYKTLLALKEKYRCFEKGVPAIFIAGKILVGYDYIKEGLRKEIIAALGKSTFEKGLDKLPGVDLIRHFFSFGAFTIAIAGLIDGINPCAFTVIVFFISFLTLQGYKKKELITVGLSFICAVFLTYVLVGLGIFRFLYMLNKFYLVAKIFYYAIAILCFIVGILAIYDLWVFKKTKKTEGLILQLPQAIKKQIHYIIGLHYRKTKDEIMPTAPQRHFLILIITTFFSGFLVSLLEAVCTGQLYLPTITFVLKEESLRLRALSYLLLYNFMFIVPLAIVLLFALLGATSESFSKFIKSHLVAVKLLMALIFFVLGFLILRGA